MLLRERIDITRANQKPLLHIARTNRLAIFDIANKLYTLDAILEYKQFVLDITTKLYRVQAVCFRHNHQTLYARCNTRVQFVLDVATKLCTLDVILEYRKTRIREEKTSTEHTRRKAAPFRLR